MLFIEISDRAIFVAAGYFMDIYRSAATDNRNGSKVFSLIREKFFWSSSFLAMELFDGGPKGNWTVALDEMMRYSIGF